MANFASPEKFRCVCFFSALDNKRNSFLPTLQSKLLSITELDVHHKGEQKSITVTSVAHWPGSGSKNLCGSVFYPFIEHAAFRKIKKR
jgi:hypothetical protein